MNRLPAGLAALIRLLLVLGLVCAPLAQPMAMAALAAPQAATPSGCPHHAQTDSAPAKPGDCCYKKGSPCHCAMALALPTSALPMPAPALYEPPRSATRLSSARLPAPEPPPPRA